MCTQTNANSHLLPHRLLNLMSIYGIGRSVGRKSTLDWRSSWCLTSFTFYLLMCYTFLASIINSTSMCCVCSLSLPIAKWIFIVNHIKEHLHLSPVHVTLFSYFMFFYWKQLSMRLRFLSLSFLIPQSIFLMLKYSWFVYKMFFYAHNLWCRGKMQNKQFICEFWFGKKYWFEKSSHVFRCTTQTSTE